MTIVSDTGLVSVNGKITAAEDAVVPALDRGFLFGDSIFESFVAFGHCALDVDKHLARLRASADKVGMTIPWSDAELRFELEGLAEQVPFAKKNIRLVVTRGSGLGLRVAENATPNRLVYCFRAAAEPRTTYEQGYALKRLVTATTQRGATAKTSSYQASIVGLDRARQEGYQDILWTNADGEITESSVANIFFVQREGDGIRFVTPAPMSGLLLGITRETVIELLRNATLPVEERIVYADELPRFDEAFLTSTVRGLVPVCRIDQHRLYSTRPNGVFRHVTRLYDTWVETQLGYRVDWATGNRVQE